MKQTTMTPKTYLLYDRLCVCITGEPSKTGTATIRIYTKNKNDEEPKFSQQVYTPNVDENAGPNTLVTTVVASDKDGDNVRYAWYYTNTIVYRSTGGSAFEIIQN